MNNTIKIRGARIHNLKNVDVDIPRGKLTVITGVSGSGKSSLAFDTLYEEGKRRYLMFSNTAFMIDSAPTFESITGLSPTVAVEQRVIRQDNPRSTVGTRTKISNILAVLFANYGVRAAEYDDGIPLDMAMFQKNSSKGMCAKCLGAGIIRKLDDDKLFGDLSQKVEEVVFGIAKRGALKRTSDIFYRHYGISLSQRLSELTDKQLMLIKYGDGNKSGSEFVGFVPFILSITEGRFGASSRLGLKLTEEGYMHQGPCPKCGGTGLGEAASHTTIGGKTIEQIEKLYIHDLLDFFKNNNLHGKEMIREIVAKLEYIEDIGLHHLSLSRSITTLSGGEIQRLFLASYIIADIDSIIFVFDEPTIGLHETEKAKLINIIQKLVQRGNTVVAVEHDKGFMSAADYIIDLGPRAGEFGGEMIFQGTHSEFMSCQNSKTAPYLSGKTELPRKSVFRPVNQDRLLSLAHCSIHNLHDISLDIPLGLTVGVAGVSGSGKSSLIGETLVPKLKEALKGKFVSSNEDEGAVDLLPNVEIKGVEHIKKCIVVDQKPIGRSRTSCPASYTGIFDRIRALFAKESGMDAGFFTVNSKGGCTACKGDGEIHYYIGMGNYIDLVCESCGGSGFIEDVMTATLDGKNIREILAMSVHTAVDFFRDKDNSILKMLQTLERVGMGYIGLGQKTPTISGGEAQRIKLAAELGKSGNISGNVYILDEPTTGLSFADIELLIHLIQELVDNGATVIVTEHDPALLSNCDYIIEMGPGGGSDGGYILTKGTPEELRHDKKSIIGQYLK